MKYLIILFCFMSFAFAQEEKLRHVVALQTGNGANGARELAFFIDRFDKSDVTRVTYRYQNTGYYPEAIPAKTLNIQLTPETNDNLERLEFIELQLEDGHTIAITVLRNGICEVISTSPSLPYTPLKTVPCRYSRVQGRPGMSGGN